MNMKRKLLLLTFMLIYLSCVKSSFAQDYKIKFQSHTIDYNIGKDKKSISSYDINKADKYFIIQFKEIPSEVEKKELYNLGIELIDYIPDYAYLATKKTKRIKLSSKSDLGILRLEEYKPDYKLDYRIFNNDIPKWAVAEFGKVNISVVFFEKVNIRSEKFQKLNICNVKCISQNFYQLEISESKINDLAEIQEVKWIELIKPEKQLSNKNQRTMHRASVVNSDLAIGKGLYGEGIIIGEFDGGSISEHQDLVSNIINHSKVGNVNHSTHVAGSIIGKGLINPEIKGIAPDAYLHSWDFYTDNPMGRTDTAIFDENLNLVTNSWGYSFSPYSCYNSVPYLTNDREYDFIARKYPKVLQVFATGNDQQICNEGYLTASWNMKNVLFVGAVDNNEVLADFSSCGPLYDGRIVPHVVGMGVDVYSTALDQSYEYMSGTSMSTPGVTGSVALLYEAYKKKYNEFPTSSLAKALVCNTAKDLGNPGPDYQYGFGRIDILKAVESVEDASFFEGNVKNTQTVEHEFTIESGVDQLKITLVWNDRPAYPGVASALVDDMDLSIEKPDGGIVYPLVLNPLAPSSIAENKTDNINNIEQVVIKQPIAGTYKIKVRGKTIQVENNYSVAYCAEKQNLQIVFPIGNEKLISGNIEYIRWNSSNYNDQINLFISEDNGSTWNEITAGLNANIRNYEFTLPKISNKNVKIKVVQGSVYSESEALIVAPVSEKIEIDANFESGYIKWNKVENASSYDVFSIDNGDIKLLETVSDTFFTANKLITNKKQFFTIQSNLSDYKSQRNIAQSVTAIPKVDVGIKTALSPLPGAFLGEEELVTIRIINKGAGELVAGTKLPVKYSVNNGDPVEDTITLSCNVKRNETCDFSFSKVAYMSVSKLYNFKFEVEHAEDTIYKDNNIFNWRVLHFDEITEYPYKENFDLVYDLTLNEIEDNVYLGRGWDNDYVNDDFEWWPWDSDTYKDGTGPSEDHTSGKGKFLYTESFFFDGEIGTMNLFSPYFNINSLSQPLISFWYHMYAEELEMGSLYLDIFSVKENKWYENVWTKSGTQAEEWRNTLIDISDYKNKGLIRCRFRVVTSDTYQNAVAIDDFEMYEGDIYDLKIDSIGLNQDGGLLNNEEIVKIYYSNIGGKEIPVGEKLSFQYQLNNDTQVNEDFIVEEAILTGDHIVYVFNAISDLSDITKRNIVDFEIRFLKDKRQSNNKIRNMVVQAYNEPTSVCDVGYYYMGVLNMGLEGAYSELSIENYNTLCSNTEVEGYSFYAEQIATVYKGEKYELGYQSIPFTKVDGLNPTGQYVKVWIDYNQDGIFDNDEAVSQSNHRGIAYEIDEILIPESAKLGLTRMRVRSSYYKEDIISDNAADNNFDYGETEDYTIKIIEEPQYNIGLNSFKDKPFTFSGLSENEKLSINLINSGSVSIDASTALKISYSVNGNVNTEDYTLTNNFMNSESLIYEFNKKLDLSLEGKYIIKAWVDLVGDEDCYNDTLYLTVINLPTENPFEYSENFESIDDQKWFATATKNKNVWDLGLPTTRFLNTTHSGANVWGTVLDGNYLPRTEAILYSPVFDFTEINSANLSFWISSISEPGFDGMILEASIDGFNWAKLGENESEFYNIENKGKNNLGSNIWSDYSEGWKKKEISLKQYCGKKEVAFRYRFVTDENQDSEGFCLDDIVIESTKTTTSVNEILNDNINVYPNPFTEGINIDCSNTTGDLVVKILDVTGADLKTEMIDSCQERVFVNLNSLPSGVYMLQLITEGKKMYSKQIIKY